MNLEKLYVILPCQSLEGYALDRQVDHAEELLSAWSAPYHPALLAAAGAIPKWFPASDPPKDVGQALVLLPPSSEAKLSADWLKLAADAGACVIRGLQHRDAMVQAALERLAQGPHGVSPQLVADFLALGFCKLQVEVLIRDAGYGMGTDVYYYDEQYYSYAGQFDRERFERQTVEAARAAVEGDEPAARDRLRAAFALLTDARRGLPYTYSAEQDPHLLDLTLVAPSTIGQPLREELASGLATNLLISGQTIERMARDEPETLAALQEAVAKGTAVVIGGEYDERALPLLGPEAIREQLQRGLEAYVRHLQLRPTVFGRRRFGLGPFLPQVLRQVGFAGAVHFTLDDGHFPTSRKSKIWWVGLDGTEVEALAQLPLDAARSSSFLNFASKVSNTGYQEHNATAVLAHWPGHASPWYGDLERMAAYSPVLGQFRTITDYFQRSQSISEWKRSGPDEYRSPYLRQSVAHHQRDPISSWAGYHRRRAAADALQAMALMIDLIGAAAGIAAHRPPSDQEDLLRKVEASEHGDPAESAQHAALEERLERAQREATARFAAALPRQTGPATHGCLIINPWSFPRRVVADVSALSALPDVGGPVRAAGESAGRKQAVVEVPAMGFAWVGPGTAAAASQQAPLKQKKWGWKRQRKERPMAEENMLRNEHFEVTIHPATGGIQAIDDYVSRGALVAQQLALRLPHRRQASQEGFAEDDPEQDYSLMAADRIEVTSAGPIVAEIVSRGRLLSRQGERLARYVQTVRAHRASPILELCIDLEVEREPDADPWRSYYAARFAWGDSAAEVFRGVCLASRPTERPQVESPYFLDVRGQTGRITILAGGLPYHRRLGVRKLDTLLVVRGETARHFRLGIGVNLTHPVPAALDFLAPACAYAQKAPPPAATSGWLFHVDSKNVVATHFSPLRSDGRTVGFRVRLMETEGRAGQTNLRAPRPLASARKVDFQGQGPTPLAIQGDRITIDLKAHQWVQVEAEFAR